MKISLSEIKIGKLDGYTESQLSDFDSLFYTGNRKYQQLQDSSYFIISGRKGTGKTILSKHYEKMMEDVKSGLFVGYVIMKTLEMDELIEFSYATKSYNDRQNYQRYFLFKQFAIVIEEKFNKISYFKYITKNGFIKFFRLLKSVKSIRNLSFIKESKINSDFVPFEKQSIVKKNGGLSSTVGVNEAGSLSTTQNYEITSSVSYKKSEYFQKLGYLEEMVKTALSCLKVEIFLDDFDDLPKASIDETNQYIADFIINTSKVNAEIREFSNSRCVLLLRDDILKRIESTKANLNKIVASGQIHLNWINTKENKSMLTGLIHNKIIGSIKSEATIELKDIFSYKQSKNGDAIRYAPIEYIIDNSFGRPRDVIAYINNIVESYPNNTIISMNLVKECNKNYSVNYFLPELKGEMSSHYDSEFIDISFTILRMIGKSKFEYEEFELAKANISSKSNEEITSKEYLKALFRFSAIGYQNVHSKKGIIEKYYNFQYFESSELEPEFSKIFIVHYGLWKALNIMYIR